MAIAQAFGRSEEEAHDQAHLIIGAMLAVEQKPAVAKAARHYYVRSPKLTDLPSPEQNARYDAYFDECEKANKHPLDFDGWVRAGEPDHG